MHFGDDKTKSIFFASTWRAKNIRNLNTRYTEINIKQQAQVTYLGCLLDESIFGKPMALKVIFRIIRKLKFHYKKNKFLTPDLRRMSCNAHIQPHFGYACPT